MFTVYVVITTYTVHSEHSTPQSCTVFTVQCMWYIVMYCVHCVGMWYIVMYCVHCAVYVVHCDVPCVHCVVYVVHCDVLCSLCSVCGTLWCTVFTVQCMWYIVMYCVHCVVYVVHCDVLCSLCSVCGTL